MRCPCRKCWLLDENKNNYLCWNCQERRTYDDYIRKYFIGAPAIEMREYSMHLPKGKDLRNYD
jgi:hypothetical protein